MDGDRLRDREAAKSLAITAADVKRVTASAGLRISQARAKELSLTATELLRELRTYERKLESANEPATEFVAPADG